MIPKPPKRVKERVSKEFREELRQRLNVWFLARQ